jgi:hypothetical protein
MKAFSLLTLLGFSALLFSCKPTEDPGAIGANDKNNVVLKFDNRLGGQKLVLNQTVGRNASGEEVTITAFNYFISNIHLTKADGTVLKFPDNYYLVRQVDATSQRAVLPDVPAGDYREISFLIGVDSARSAAPVERRTGVLDVASYGDDGMYWSWNSGYIFLKLEGTSPAAPLRANGLRQFQWHVGGFGGYAGPAPNNLRRVTLPLGSTPAQVRRDIAPEIHLLVDALQVFDGVTPISLARTAEASPNRSADIHSPAVAGPVATNYTKMFVIDHVHNDRK